MSKRYIQDVKNNQEHFDKVKQVLENTFNEIMADGGNGRLAKYAKESYQVLDGFTKIVQELEKFPDSQ